MTDGRLAGGCLCGAVRFASDARPITVRHCWCRDCQHVSGGAGTINVFLPSDTVMVEGAVRWFDSVADSGTPLSRGFCATCGSPLFTQSHARRHLIGIRVGAFDDPAPHAPAMAIWTISAPDWATIDPELPRVERQPPPAA
ncbi:GFA family protein [Sphingomonas nostoxanthinifaciens]|uniref:GFA family protein n=1 Tax=Sphingomonas nostoxanthinifaciens TaxID=2872652 RepID=UPI001CC1DBAF|nr:GFA family protein [Sphingomonas nostoxanthinifaciens]UAK26295.1 GFA family protein [Sphingomonas nostoxanthinifaciens]